VAILNEFNRPSVKKRTFSTGSTVELICLTTTAFSLCKPPIFLKEPIARKPKPFAKVEGHDLATC